jgi:hypothetical protein
MRAAVPWLMALALLVSIAPASPASTALAAQSVALPFIGGKSVKIIQGYNGGTHQGRSKYGLDLVLAEGGTSGAEVVSPIDGTVTYGNAPRSGTGCIGIVFSDASYTVMMCHVILSKTYGHGEAVKRGQTLGTVGEPGAVGNNGVSHVHMELHTGNSLSTPIPFSAPGGLPLDGNDLPASSTTAVVAKLSPMTSSNRGGKSDGTVVAQTDARPEKLSSKSDSSDPAPVKAASLASETRSIPSSITSTVSAAGGGRVAVVRGTDSCLNVHKQPAVSSATVGCLKEGTEITLKPLAANADATWRQTDQGWISAQYLKRTGAVVNGTGDCLNVRDAAKSTAAKLGCLPDGTAVTISDGPTTVGSVTWYRIEPAGSVDKSGWVSGKYLD